MKLSKDFVTLFDAAAKRGAIEDEAQAAAIAMLFNNRNTNQSGKKI